MSYNMSLMFHNLHRLYTGFQGIKVTQTLWTWNSQIRERF